MALTSKQQAFVTAYLDGGMSNAAAAYRVAYPASEKWLSQSVASKANEMLNHVDIKPIIEAAKEKARKALRRSEDRYAVSKERISRALAQMAFADARKLYTWTASGVTLKASDELTDDEAAAVIAVSHTVTKDGGTIRVQIADKRQALMDLAKLHGHIVEKRDVRVIRSVDDLTEAELETLAGAKVAEERRNGTRH